MQAHDFVVLGAGVSGLAAAAQIGEDAAVYEKSDRAGGLVKTECVDGYWFDHVLHLLHIQNDQDLNVLNAMGDLYLYPKPPKAKIVTRFGTTNYPIQLHLNGLEKDKVADILIEIAELQRDRNSSDSYEGYEEYLLRTFGPTLCELFYFPYNKKMWCTDLTNLSTDSFTWNIHPPNFSEVVRGALLENTEQKTYNSNSFYPLPPKDHPVRGMEVLSKALAGRTKNLYVDHEINCIDPARQLVKGKNKLGPFEANWRAACICTLPLTVVAEYCVGFPEELNSKVQKLKFNDVYSLAVRVKGSRPNFGLWNYYADETISFTRAIFLHEFDPMLAPPDGWPLLLEIPKPSNFPSTQISPMIDKAISDCRSRGIIQTDDEVLGVDVFKISPAYVVFGHEHLKTANEAKTWLRKNGIHMLGRYGRWEYSSMHSVIADGLALGKSLTLERSPISNSK